MEEVVKQTASKEVSTIDLSDNEQGSLGEDSTCTEELVENKDRSPNGRELGENDNIDVEDEDNKSSNGSTRLDEDDNIDDGADLSAGGTPQQNSISIDVDFEGTLF